MDYSKISDWLQIVASIGVLIGLMAVAYELRQNSVHASVDHYRENHRNWMQVSYLEIESDIYDSLARAVDSPQELSPEDKFKISAWLTLNMSVLVYGDEANQLGVATSTALLSEGAARYYFATQFSREWFEGNRGWLGDRQVELIDRVIKSTPLATSSEELFGRYLIWDQE